MISYRSGYRFVPWRYNLEEECYEPDLPEEVKCELIADFTRSHLQDAIYLLRWDEETPEPPGVRAVSDPLVKLLESATAYPPALAIARDVRFRKDFDDRSAEEAVEEFTTVLRDELRRQRDRPFFLARALANPSGFVGYKTEGCYYWIVGYRPQRVGREVSWVSRDFFVYQDPLTDFDVDVAYLAERFAVRPKVGV